MLIRPTNQEVRSLHLGKRALKGPPVYTRAACDYARTENIIYQQIVCMTSFPKQSDIPSTCFSSKIQKQPFDIMNQQKTVR